MIGSLIGGIIGGNQQQAGYNNASGTLNAGYGQGNTALTNAYNTSQATLQPYNQLGLTPLNSLINSGYSTNQFNNTDLNANLAPNYAFQLGQGQQANLMANNATGGAVSGNTLKSLQDYTQNYASNAYQNAFTNYQNQRSNIFGNLQPIAAMGQSGTNALASGQTSYGTNIANLDTGLAAAVAGNQINAANAQAASTQSTGSQLGSMLSTGANAFMGSLALA
jgi:hypothetical protein